MKKMRTNKTRTAIIVIACAFLSTNIVMAHAFISEIMYNPAGNDNNKEFIEIMLEHSFPSFQNCTVTDESSADQLSLMKQGDEESAYIVIVEDGFDQGIMNASPGTFYSAGATIGDNLNNDGDTVSIHCDDTLIANATYDGGLANGNRHSLEWWLDAWVESLENGTPGWENTHHDNASQEENSTQENATDNTADDLPRLTVTAFLPQDNTSTTAVVSFLLSNVTNNSSITLGVAVDVITAASTNTSTHDLTFLPPDWHTSIGVLVESALPFCLSVRLINASTPISYEEELFCYVPPNNSVENETHNITNGTGNVSNETQQCTPFSWQILSNTTVESGTQLRFRPRSNATTFILDYWIEDIYGAIRKEHRNTSNDDVKTHTAYTSQRGDIIYLKGAFYQEGCPPQKSFSMFIVLNASAPPPSCPVCAPATKTSNAVSASISCPTARANTQYALVDTFDCAGTTKGVILLNNREQQEHVFNISAYVFRGSANYTRRDVLQTVTIVAGEAKAIIASMDTSTLNGSFKLKVRITKDNNTTPTEFTQNITLLERQTTPVQASLQSTQLAASASRDGQNVTNSTPQQMPLAGTGHVTYVAKGMPKSIPIMVIISLLTGIAALLAYRFIVLHKKSAER